MMKNQWIAWKISHPFPLKKCSHRSIEPMKINQWMENHSVFLGKSMAFWLYGQKPT